MEIRMKILCYIFSWKGQYENAVRLENQITSLGVSVKVINSDDDNQPKNWINIGNACYFSDQFRKCLDDFNTKDYDVLWHIQADAKFEDFSKIVDSAKSSFDQYNWGIYAPNVDDTFYISSRTDVFSLKENQKVVATTDNTCWFIHKDIISELNKNLHLMEDNKLGWGWDLLLCGFSHIQKRYVIRDYNYTIDHPSSTGYMKEEAEKEMFDMFNKCPEELKEVIYYIKQNPDGIKRYYNIINQEIVFSYDTERAI